MNVPRTFRVKTSLADKMRRPGGRTMASALAAATAALNSHRDEAMNTTVDTLARLQAMAALQNDGQASWVYEQAAALVDLAGFFQTGPLYEAAYGLCDICDRMQAAGVWHWPSVEVHLQALAFILSEDCRHTPASDAVLAGLRAVTDRVPVLPRG